MFLLDSDVLVGLLRKDKDASGKIIDLLKKTSKLYISVISLHELFEGAYLSEKINENINFVQELAERVEIIEINEEIVFLSGKLSTELIKEGNKIGDLDVFIAASTIVNGFTLVTRNTKHFKNIKGLKIMEW